MSIKVDKFAKELGIKTEELIEALKKLYVDVDDGESVVEEKIAALIRIKLGKGMTSGEAKKEAVKKPKTTKTTKTKKKTSAGKTDEDGAKDVPIKKTRKKKSETVEKTEEGAKPKKSAKKTTTKKKEPVKEKRLDRVIVVKSAREQEPKTVKKEKPAPAAEEVKEAEKKPIVLAKDIFKKVTASDGEADGEKSESGKTKKIFKPSKRGPGKTFRKFKNKRSKKTAMSMEDLVAQGVAFEEIKPYEGTDFKKIEMQLPADIRSIAAKINRRANDLIQYLMKKGLFININQVLEEDLVRDLLKDLGYELEVGKTIEEDLMAEHVVSERSEKGDTVKRAPVVTFMGHVDHGKTSLLDYIRQTMVVEKEKGGITQHIGAYKVETEGGMAVTFLDTPGHEAFTAMRARGAEATDVVVLVVAADDGVMPQTREAIGHARAAGVPIIVAINKCDLPGANPDRVKLELQKEELISEDYGGTIVMVEVSAKTGQGISDLVEMLMLESELLELKSNPALRARGIIIEAKKSAGQGVTTTVLVQNGTLHVGDIVLSGIYYGRVKAMISDRGERVTDAKPSTPVEVLGLQGVPEAGEAFYVVKDEKKARTLTLLKQQESRKSNMVGSQRVSLEDFHSMVEVGDIKELKLILRADVQGSVEAIVQSIKDLSTEEVKVSFVQAMVGDISESDVMLALVSNAVILGFHVKVETKAEALAKQENVDINKYDVIYEAISDVKAAMEGLLEPIEQEAVQGYAQVKQVFPAKNGKAAGCMITKGKIKRKDRIKVKRNKEVIFDGSISALKRFKDDVKEVREGFECGITIQGFNDVQAGDIFEAYIVEKIARRLDKKRR